MAERDQQHRVSVKTHIDRLQEVLAVAIGSHDAETMALSTGNVGGRVSAQTVTAPVPLPGFDNSQMDGFAVRLADLGVVHGATELPLVGIVPAGAEPTRLPPGGAMAVMTGAPIPDGTDLVIPVERTVEGSFDALLSSDKHTDSGPRSLDPGGAWPPGGTVRFTGLDEDDLRPGRFIRRVGSDVAEGEVLIRTGEVLSPAHLGVLAAAGQTELDLIVRTRVLLLSTGDEVRTPGSPLRAGQTYDADTPLIRATLESFGCVVAAARVTDDLGRFMQSLDGLIADHEPHVVVTAGGISMGAYEVVRQALEPHGITFGSVATARRPPGVGPAPRSRSAYTAQRGGCGGRGR